MHNKNQNKETLFLLLNQNQFSAGKILGTPLNIQNNRQQAMKYKRQLKKSSSLCRSGLKKTHLKTMMSNIKQAAFNSSFPSLFVPVD